MIAPAGAARSAAQAPKTKRGMVASENPTIVAATSMAPLENDSLDLEDGPVR